MQWDVQSIVGLITAFGIGGIIQAIVNFFKDRKKNQSDTNRTDVDTKLAYLSTVIERLGEEAIRVQEERDRLHKELTVEQQRSAMLRQRVRELEDEIDGVRRSARETQHKCDELAIRLKELVKDAQE